jgi:hypothetical protein
MSELPLGRLVIDEHPLVYVSERGPRFSRGGSGVIWGGRLSRFTCPLRDN